jgi:putative resolvase
MNETYVTTKKACEILGICPMTLRNWDRGRKIETIRNDSNKRLYNVKKYLREHSKEKLKEDDEEIETKQKKICYIRVSTHGQIDDLKRQRKHMEKKYIGYQIIEDIGSGINFNRRGLRKIIKMAISGSIKELVVAHRDRLTRFGFEFIEDLIKEYSNGKITLDDNLNRNKEPKEEIVDDVLQILNVYVAKINGMRRYKKII